MGVEGAKCSSARPIHFQYWEVNAMADFAMPGCAQDNDACLREAVCVHTRKIFDSCRDKDCAEDLRFYPAQGCQEVIDKAISVKPGTAELLYVYIDVEPVGFNRGYYTVDARYFYKVTADAFVGAACPVTICGLATFSKRAILFGSEGSAKVFSSDYAKGCLDKQAAMGRNLPVAYVEAVDPILLGMKLVDSCECRTCDCDLCEVPSCVCNCFGCDIDYTGGSKRIYLTLGQFSIIRLERDTQLLIPVYDYCMPEKECSCGNDSDPCEVFQKVEFPVNEFFPPNSMTCAQDTQDKGCGCNN